jgi:hypothetical protein
MGERRSRVHVRERPRGGGDGAKALLPGGVPDLAVPCGGGGPVLCGGDG